MFPNFLLGSKLLFGHVLKMVDFPPFAIQLQYQPIVGLEAFSSI